MNVQRNNSRSNLTTIDAPLSSINTTSATVLTTNSQLPPLLLRRSTSNSFPDENPTPNIPIADEDPGDRALNVSSHKRKTSGIPLEAEAIVRRDSKLTYIDNNLGAIDDGDEEEGPFTPHNNGGGGGFEDYQEHWSSGNTTGYNTARNFRMALVSQPKNMGLLALGVLIITYLFSSSTATVGDNAEVVPPVPLGEGGAASALTPKDNSQSGITYGEEHMEVVGVPKEAHVHEFNKILFYDSPSKMEVLHSKGPIQLNDAVRGLHLYENVCLTNNVDRRGVQDLRGLIYFNDKVKGEKRCVPCEKADGEKDKRVNHDCGMNGLNIMYASSVNDWTTCIGQEENMGLMAEFHQTQAPLEVNSIHFFKESTFLLQFNALDMETSLFDMLMTYLPHWDNFREEWNFPFDAVISHSLQGCLSHSHNWFCEVLHQMNAFGPAKEIPWEPNDTTLYCFKELIYNEVGYQRNLDQGDLVNREILGEFREILFRKFALPRRRTVEDRKEEADAIASLSDAEKKEDGIDVESIIPSETKIIFYDNKLSQQTKWNEMESLITKARSLEKYSNIKFVTVDDFSTLTVAQQARTFNEADAVIMVHGEHMANAIFAVDGTTFVEVGCKVQSLIGNANFMNLMDGTYKSVERCKGEDDAACVVCEGDDDYADFTMTPAVFEKMIDDVVQSLNA